MISSLYKNFYGTDNEIKLYSGDLILLFTDGIIESANDKGEMFSEEKLKEIFKNSSNKNPHEIIEAILSELKAYDTDDDVTMLVVKKA